MSTSSPVKVGSGGSRDAGSSRHASAVGGRGFSAVGGRGGAAVGGRAGAVSGRDATETSAAVSSLVPLSTPHEMSITEGESSPTRSETSDEYGPNSGFGPHPVGKFL